MLVTLYVSATTLRTNIHSVIRLQLTQFESAEDIFKLFIFIYIILHCQHLVANEQIVKIEPLNKR